MRSAFQRSWGPAGVVLLLALAHRVAYVASEPEVSGRLGLPSDGVYYLDWARSLSTGGGEPPGAFYLAPLYPHLLAVFLRLAGERLGLLYLLQHVLVLAAAAALATIADRRAGRRAALATALLFALYPPLLYYPTRPFAEPLALFLLAAAVALADREGRRSAAGSGLFAGLTALARPNLLLAPLVWSAGEAAAGRRARAALLAAATLALLVPVALWNLRASGHLVLVSSNGGITAFHGNGPGAAGIFTHPPGFSGSLLRQREEATAIARAHTGLPLDEVEADRWWGRQALRLRLADPAGTLALLARRALYTLGSFEHGLEEQPRLDRNPWSTMVRPPWVRREQLPELERRLPLVPFGLLAALAAAGLVAGGSASTGGWRVWSAIAVAAIAPLAFYVSSRYRLPLAALLTLPAGCGCVLLVRGLRAARGRALAALGVAVAVGAIASVDPPASLRAQQFAGALVNRGVVCKASGDLEGAERYMRAALVQNPASSGAQFALGVVLEARGVPAEAERAYRESLLVDPGNADAAGNLARLLLARGEAEAALGILEPALARRPSHVVCWTHLVVALSRTRGMAAAHAAVVRARAAGVVLDPELLVWLEGGGR